MATTLQFRRGTTATAAAVTGAIGELYIDTDKKTIRVHDGSTAGGNLLISAGDTATVTNTMLAGSIANNKLANSAITINSASTSLGGSVTLYAGTTALGTSSGSVTLPNSSLTNSAITINSASTSLGGSVTLYLGTTTLQTSSAAQSLTGIGLIAQGAPAPTIASATTIAPTTRFVFISGTEAISTITPPASFSTGGGQIILIPTDLFTTVTGGNIALGTTAVVGKAIQMTYDSGTALWYPSY